MRRSSWTGAAATRLPPTTWRKPAAHCCSTTAPKHARPAHADYAGSPKIRVLDEAELEALPDASVDLIVVNSVVQYLSASQFADALRLFHRLLKRDGTLLLGDIIAPDTPLVGHATTFLRFAWQNGFFVAAIIGLARNFASPYRKLRRDAGYACYTQTQLLGLLDDNGFSGERLASNIAVSQLRSSYLARKSSAEGVSSNDGPCDDLFRRPSA